LVRRSLDENRFDPRFTGMNDDRPSVMAERVALYRAVHQLLDHPLVFEDRLALSIVEAAQAAEMHADPKQFANTHLLPHLRAFPAVRSRVAEDELGAAVVRGVTQYIVLGAGLDTFAYRNPYPDLRVFEVDHPTTQRWKRRRLTEAGIALPPSVTFVPLDLAAGSLPVALLDAGFASGRSAFVSWLGVTPYLSAADTLAVLAAIARLTGGGGGVVFDYIAKPRTWSEKWSLRGIARRAERVGEPFLGLFEPQSLVAELRRIGFLTVHDLDGRTLNARYLAGGHGELHIGPLARLVVART
jgi:methyltransferase (TIGR00027 family)